jgi:hypothetical protein
MMSSDCEDETLVGPSNTAQRNAEFDQLVAIGRVPATPSRQMRAACTDRWQRFDRTGMVSMKSAR